MIITDCEHYCYYYYSLAHLMTSWKWLTLNLNSSNLRCAKIDKWTILERN